MKLIKFYNFLFLFFVIISAKANISSVESSSSLYIDSSLSFNDELINTNNNSFHLYSHGKPGELFIEGKWKSKVEIVDFIRKTTKNQHIKEIFIYGCEFAKGKKGIDAVSYIAEKLNVDINASNDVTGKDGNWDLEVGSSSFCIIPNNFQGNLQLDSEHYFNPNFIDSYTSANITEDFIYLSTPSVTNITVNITDGAGNSISSNVLNLTTNITSSGQIIDGVGEGLIFKSNNPLHEFYVNYRARSTNQAGSVNSKGKTALGKEFRWGGAPTEYTQNVANVGNMLSIMAVENNTIITINNIDSGTEFYNGNNPIPLSATTYVKTLQKGQSFILYSPQKSVSSPNDYGWLGAKVTSDKNIVCTVGGLMMQGGAGNVKDIGLDQIVPAKETGLKYAIMQGNGGNSERVIIIANNPNTNISVNGGLFNYNIVNAGDYIVIDGSKFNAQKNMYISTDKPVYCFHKIFGGASLATNSLMFIPPISCFGQKEVDLIPKVDMIGSTTYTGTELLVLYANGATLSVNGVAAGGTTGTLTGNSNFLTRRISHTGNAKISSNGNIQVTMIGASGAAGYGGYYSGFGEIPIIIISPSSATGEQACVGLSTLSVDLISGASYEWFKNGVAIPSSNSNTYFISDPTPATYNVEVTLLGGCKVGSNFVGAILCPCVKPMIAGSPQLNTPVGISTTTKPSNSNWPEQIPNAFVVIDSKNKGFVVTRLANPSVQITSPVEGMVAFDTTENCLKLYNGSVWKCIEQTCVD